LDTRWLKNHISLKHQYADIKGIKGVGMPTALKMEGLTMEGTHHRGIDDAKNIAKIFMTCFDEWEFPI
jgi:inhibitor of KinA sporulation pathway (predicted exonuclease)